MISLSNITKNVGGVPLYEGVSFQIHPGEKVGLVGPNGSGKTTFFRLIVGELSPDGGSVSIQKGARIAYFSQSVGEMRGRTALEEVVAGDKNIASLGVKLHALEAKLADPALDPETMERLLERLGDIQHSFEVAGGYAVESAAQEVLTGLGIFPADHDKPVEEFSGGWKMRIALAKVLIVNPDLILMDEPTNYLDMETILWLEEWLRKFEGAYLLTTHDREFMNRVITKIVEVDNGEVTTYSGDYDFYERERAIKRRNNAAKFERQRSRIRKDETFIARFKARASHAAQVQARVKMLDKIERVELITDGDAMTIELPEVPRGGNDVIVIRELAKSWTKRDGGELPVFSGLSGIVKRLDRIAVVGVNGAGKSTFLKVLGGQAEPTAGSVVVGPSIDIGYFGQYTLEMLDPESTVFRQAQEHLPGRNDPSVRSLLAAFLFRGDEIHKRIRTLSGGEKARVALAILLSKPYNCLLLDEPTNHLDIISRGVLLDALKRYEGTVVLVSHDRHFLREITTRVFEIDHGRISIYEGNYGYYLENRKPS